jgi:tetrahydromethanopterin S-methyltransferase subunit G
MQQLPHHQPHHKYSKDVARILRRMIERKIENVLGEDQFGFRRRKVTRDAIGILRIISE